MLTKRKQKSVAWKKGKEVQEARMSVGAQYKTIFFFYEIEVCHAIKSY